MKKKRILVTALITAAVGTIFLPFCSIKLPQTVAAEDRALPKSVVVLGKVLELKDSQGSPGEKFIAEYIPAGETFDNWTLMFASRFVSGPNPDPAASAAATAKRIFARRETGDPVANAAVFKAPDGKSIVVDFLISQGDIFEHNVFRYFATPKGLASLQIARRVYDDKSGGDSVQEFIKSIKTKRETILNEIMRTDLPVGSGA